MNNNIIGRILLSPFTLLYSLGVGLRNVFYDSGILKSTSFNVPVISVGNLSVGGAGKSPHVEYLIMLLQEYLNVAVLSRGYKRKSKGFKWVYSNDQVTQTGDEPLQFKRKFPEVAVAVCESRNIGIPMMLQGKNDIQTILLDDAFQHRSVVPGLNILLTTYDEPYTRDYLLPSGRLREFRSSAKRADVIIVTKCPKDLSPTDITKYRNELKPKSNQQLYFSSYEYGDPYYMYNPTLRKKLTRETKVVLLSAIANVEYLIDYLDVNSDIVQLLKYEDHHYFKESELILLEKIIGEINDPNTIVITTEKDAMRLDLHRKRILDNKIPIFALPIKVKIHPENDHDFDQSIKDFLLNFTA